MDKEFKKKVAKFMRFFVGKLIKKSEELSKNDIPPVYYFDERIDNLAVDYGVFLNYLTEWIAEENRIKKEDVSKLYLLLFWFSL